MKIAGAAGVLASCSPPAGPQKLIPYLVPPEDIVPGVPLFFRTVCRECPAGCGATARTREGRVVKLEGNPDDPIGRGALCARGQSAVQRLYAPDRYHGPMRRNATGVLSPVGWDDALAEVIAALTAAKATPDSIRLLTRPEPGGAGELQREFMAGLGARAGQRLVFDPQDVTPLRKAGEILFARPELPVFDLGAARTVVSFGADLVETWLSPVELARGLATGRGRVGPDRTRLVWVGPRLTLTGASADAWLPVSAGSEPRLAAAVLRWLCDPANQVPGLAREAREVFSLLEPLDPTDIERSTGVDGRIVVKLARELAQRRPSAVLGPGLLAMSHQATQLAVAVQLVNYVLGNIGKTVLYGLDSREDEPAPFSALQTLVGDMAAGRVRVLLLHHADPVGSLPKSLAASEAIAKVPLVVSFADAPDESTAHAHLVLPDNHPLESFGDVVPRRGIVALGQPAMTPLWNTRSASQVLLDLLGQLPPPAAALPYDDVYSFFQSRTAKLFTGLSAAALATAQRKAQEIGGVYAVAPPEPVTLHLPPREVLRPGPAELTGDGALTLVPFPTALRQDGGGAPPPWLREIPDALTTISWTGWVELSPATAGRLGITDGDILEVATSTGRVERAAYAYPGLRDDVLAMPLGDGGVLRLLPGTSDELSGGLAWLASRATVHPTGRRITLPRLEGTPNEEGRTIVRTVSAAAPTLPHVSPPEQMYPPPRFPKHRWAMVIDMDRCTGCQACVAACYAENNVPVVGPQAMANGRNMAWIRLEHFFERDANQLRVHPLVMLCQQCGNAPCEPVCPVYATFHTDEGLNAQVYNRCVGTRYCSNNCPYKVRVFNWRDPSFPAPLNLQLNPDVTVRSKGVMEKCTFCVQRIRAGKLAAEAEKRDVRDGEIVPACAQTCPSRAIVFGDADDPESRVSRLQGDGRAYQVLAEINTRPAVTYLARVREDET